MKAPVFLYRLFGLLCSSLLLISPSQAQSAEALYQAGNQAYEAGKFDQALARYDSVRQAGLASPRLYYNLGNAHYKLGHTGQAILNYERALKLDPGYEDAQFNLRLARQQVVDRIEPEALFVLTRWWRSLTQGQTVSLWGYLSLGLMWLSLGSVALLLFGAGQWRRVAFILTIVCGLSALLTLGLGSYRHAQLQEASHAIVIRPNAYLKNAPDGPTDLMILHEGAKVEYLDQVGQWAQVRISGANVETTEGFLPIAAIEPI